MRTGISEQEILQGFRSRVGAGVRDHAPVRGRWIVTVTRANGTVERTERENVVTALGLNHLAERCFNDNSSKYGWLAIGTANYTPHINSQEILECDRKASGSINFSYEVFYITATWGGAADSVTSNQIEMAAVCNHQTSGSGHYLNVVDGVSTVLADSDFLHLECQIQIGSHNIA